MSRTYRAKREEQGWAGLGWEGAGYSGEWRTALEPRELGLNSRASYSLCEPRLALSLSVPHSLPREEEATRGHGGDLLVLPDDPSASHCHP